MAEGARGIDDDDRELTRYGRSRYNRMLKRGAKAVRVTGIDLTGQAYPRGTDSLG